MIKKTNFYKHKSPAPVLKLSLSKLFHLLIIMKTKFFVFALLMLCTFNFSQSMLLAQPSWSRQILSPPNGGVGIYTSVQFLNSLTGWAGGYADNDPNPDYGVLLKTTNGGETWVWVNLGWSTNFSIKLFFLNENTGWTWISSGQIKKTTDGGTSWIDQSFDGGSLNSLVFLNSQTGYAAGFPSAGVFRKTTNGGTSWVTIFSIPYQLNKIKFFNEQTGWVSGDQYFAKTTDGGNNWIQLLNDNSLDYFFLNAQTGWVTIPGFLYNSAMVKRTTDGGANWISATYPSSFNTNPFSIKFLDLNTGWCASDKGMYLSTNGGANWTLKYQSPGTSQYYDFAFIGRDSGWAVGMNMIIRTVNGNVISVNQISSNVPSEFSLKQNYPNPFNPATKISFNIKNATFASLKIFDMTGKEVKSLVNENIAAGSYEINFNASELNSGVYFYTLKTNEFTETKKMILVK